MSYQPSPGPIGGSQEARTLSEYVSRELRRVAGVVKEDAPTVFYRTMSADQGSLTAGVSANFKITAGNVIRISASATVTLTGLALAEPAREIVLINVGSAAVVLKNAAVESSASYRFALSNDWNLSANASAVLWYDAVSARWRGISRT